MRRKQQHTPSHKYTVSDSSKVASAHSVSLSSNVVVNPFVDSSSSSSSSRSSFRSSLSSSAALDLPSYRTIAFLGSIPPCSADNFQRTLRSRRKVTMAKVFSMSGILVSRPFLRCCRFTSMYWYLLIHQTVRTCIWGPFLL